MSTTLTLYAVEESLQALLDSEALITPEQEEEFRADLAEQMRTTVEKRDRVAAFIRHCEMLAENAMVERKRLEEREKFFRRTADRVRDYVRRLIEAMGRDERGKWKKLEGEFNTFSLRANPAHVELEDAAQIPAEFKTVTVEVQLAPLEEFLARVSKAIELGRVKTNQVEDTATIPLRLWQGVAGMAFWLKTQHSAPEIQKSAVKEAINSGREVPGASLVLGGNRVEIR